MDSEREYRLLVHCKPEDCINCRFAEIEHFYATTFSGEIDYEIVVGCELGKFDRR